MSEIRDIEAALRAAGVDGVSGVRIADGRVTFVIEVDPARGGEAETLRQKAEAVVRGLPGVLAVSAVMTARRSAKKPARFENAAPEIRHIIAVASGKGGVGKSTVAANLAVSLVRMGFDTGLLDADIYGPSMPMMMGLSGKPEMADDKITPPTAHGVKVMSIGLLVDEDRPMIWRGPMVQSALRQFLEDVAWGKLDFLIVDMPPGTGDAQLTMAQKVPLAGAVIVSTPQDVALLDARKGLAMFRQVGVKVLGIIENMSAFVCPECGHEAHIFGHGGAAREAERLGVPFLGAVPLDLAIREAGDTGTPIVAAQPESVQALAFAAVAEEVSVVLSAS